MRSSPFNSLSTYRNTYKIHELNTDGNSNYQWEDKTLGNTRNKAQTPLPYNSKFHRFDAISIFKSDYTIDNLHCKFDLAPKKLQNGKSSSNFLFTKNYSHKYGKESENLLKIKT
jgi:hypothetical protein